MNVKRSYLFLFFLLCNYLLSAQYASLKQKLLQVDSFNILHAREKIFIHYDRLFYNQDDTLWMKGYILSAKDLSPADSSKIVYAEVINASGEVVKKISAYCRAGIFYSNIGLPFDPGTYTLRAYTNSMKNYGDSLFFKSNFRIIQSGKNIPDRSLQSNAVQNNSNNKHLVAANSNTKTDLRFFPEGGTFIAGKWQQIGFKALSNGGKGVDVKGSIQDSKMQTVAFFSSVHKGMGVVWMKPAANEKYTAVLDNGFTVSLPPVQVSGTQIQVINKPDADSIIVMFDGSTDILNKDFFFSATANGITCAQGTIIIKDHPVRVAISKTAFPSGICRFTLYNDHYIPVNERVTLMRHDSDILDVKLSAEKGFYQLRDSVQIKLTANKKNSLPVEGSFSVSVIDTGLVPYSKYAENIISYMWLSAELKGYIEEPAYYFDKPLQEAAEALMLTQGWVKYDHFYLQPHSFKYESGFSIAGKVLNILNKPVAKSDIVLLGKTGKSGNFLLNTETDNKGNFSFTDFPVFLNDSVNVVIRALNKRGKAFGIEVKVDTQISLSNDISLSIVNGSLNDTDLTSYTQKQDKIYESLKNRKGYLQEVVIKSKVKVKGSKNLNEDGGSDQLITGSALTAMPKSTLMDVLYKKLDGFHKGPMPGSPLQVYKRNGDIIVFIIDGYNINKDYDPVDENSNAFALYEEAYLKYITAEDVAGIEIMSSAENTGAYEAYHKLYSNALVTYTFIEITTYSGHGAFNKKIPGMFLYKPMVPVLSKSFYSPRYTLEKGDTTMPDHRTTLFWKPDIITNEKGEAVFSFYTSDNSGGYLVIVQGTDMEGRLGTSCLPLLIRK